MFFIFKIFYGNCIRQIRACVAVARKFPFMQCCHSWNVEYRPVTSLRPSQYPPNGWLKFDGQTHEFP